MQNNHPSHESPTPHGCIYTCMLHTYTAVLFSNCTDENLSCCTNSNL